MTATHPNPVLRWSTRWAVFASSAAVAAIFFLNLCDLIFACGCRAPWLGAADSCNIHLPEARHCPWCATGLMGIVLPFGSILGAQALAAFLPGSPTRWHLRLALAVAAFPVVGALAGVAFGLSTGYWWRP